MRTPLAFLPCRRGLLRSQVGRHPRPRQGVAMLTQTSWRIAATIAVVIAAANVAYLIWG